MESLKTTASKKLQLEVENVASDLSRGEVGKVIESMKGPRKLINDLVVKHSELVKMLQSPETAEMIQICGSVVADEREEIVEMVQKLLSRFEHFRWMTDERISLLRQREALAKDKYGNERKPLELSPEEQELAYDLRGAAMRDSFEQTQAIKKEMAVSEKLMVAREKVMKEASIPISHMSANSNQKLVSWYKRQLKLANERAEKAEHELANQKLATDRHGNGNQTARPKTSICNCTAHEKKVGPAVIEGYKGQLYEANRSIDRLRNELVEKEKETSLVKNKMRGSEEIIDRLGKIVEREREKIYQLEHQLNTMAVQKTAASARNYRRYPATPDLLATNCGDASANRKH